MADIRAAIVRTPDVIGGRARIDGTRMAVHIVVGFLRLGKEPYTVDEFLELFPHLTRAQVQACIDYADAHPEEIAADEAAYRAEV